MTSEEMLKEIASLPAEARREIEDFVAYVRARYGRRKPAAMQSFGREKFFGIWSDRDDMTDSTAWVRSIRKKPWAS